jgi:hypothetical protein
MGRSRNPHEKVRLTLDLPAKVRERMEEIRELSGADTLTEVVRRALAVYDLVIKHTAKGGRILLEGDGETKVLEVVP